ncbi:urease accessory protein UreD [Microlunatus flavus]|uniref:Urease accessory protein UreD n=1 Tax=Microlunatus flavus TaxID=1036181 RepID=A0A1H9HN91_9ACTN|nr:urease accessory protein UreD [Microlunatus flavus]SEQ63758.1 Urease accessory protein UreH [Microlunatus flavus]
MSTTIAVHRVGGRHVVRLRQGLLRPQAVASGPDRCRVGLLATTALLLGGDVVELDVRVGAGARLDLFDVAGTVAYHGRGASSAWHVRLAVAEGATLTYAGEPFVVGDGADVTRTLQLDVAEDAAAVLRDTVVLGRTGQTGGCLRSRTRLCRAGCDVLVEDQRLDPDRLRTAPGLLGAHRVLDTVTWLGVVRPDPWVTTEVTTYALVDGAGTLARWLGGSLADSPLHRVPVGEVAALPHRQPRAEDGDDGDDLRQQPEPRGPGQQDPGQVEPAVNRAQRRGQRAVVEGRQVGQQQRQRDGLAEGDGQQHPQPSSGRGGPGVQPVVRQPSGVHLRPPSSSRAAGS